MKIMVEDGEIVLTDVFSGVGIRTDRGLFGIAQRDGGITVRLEGQDVWDSEHAVVEQRSRLKDRLQAADEALAKQARRVRELESALADALAWAKERPLIATDPKDQRYRWWQLLEHVETECERGLRGCAGTGTVLVPSRLPSGGKTAAKCPGCHACRTTTKEPT